MTKDELVEIMYEAGYRAKDGASVIATHILSAIGKENEGIVLGWDTYEDIAHREMDKLINGTNPLRGRRGKLIFREDKCN